MLNIYTFMLISWVICGVFGAVSLLKIGPWSLLFWGIVLTLFGCLPSIGLIMDGKTFHDGYMEMVGQSLLVFFSVLGGAIVSSAWSELRRSRKKEQ